jgi:hypothetical protein
MVKKFCCCPKEKFWGFKKWRKKLWNSQWCHVIIPQKFWLVRVVVCIFEGSSIHHEFFSFFWLRRFCQGGVILLDVFHQKFLITKTKRRVEKTNKQSYFKKRIVLKILWFCCGGSHNKWKTPFCTNWKVIGIVFL